MFWMMVPLHSSRFILLFCCASGMKMIESTSSARWWPIWCVRKRFPAKTRNQSEVFVFGDLCSPARGRNPSSGPALVSVASRCRATTTTRLGGAAMMKVLSISAATALGLLVQRRPHKRPPHLSAATLSTLQPTTEQGDHQNRGRARNSTRSRRCVGGASRIVFRYLCALAIRLRAIEISVP